MLTSRRSVYRWMWWGGSFTLLVLWGWGCKVVPKEQKEAPIPIEVDVVQRTDLKEALRFTGDIEGEAQVQVFASLPDQIKQLRVDVGDTVKKGDLLAVIEHTRLRQGVAQAQAQLASAQSQLAGARVSLAGARVGQSSALREYRRVQKLLRSGAIGKQQVDLAKTQYESSQTSVQAAQAQIQALVAQIQALRAAVAQAQTAKQNAIIRAPIDGIVARRYRQLGDMATPQMPLLTLVQMDKVRVEIPLSEQDLSRVHEGKSALVRVAALPGREFWGRVDKVSPTLDLDTRTAPVRIEIPNVYPEKPERQCSKNSDCTEKKYPRCYRIERRTVCADVHPLKPGMIAQVELLVKTHRQSIVVSARALLNDSFEQGDKRQQQNLAVMVLDKDQIPIRRQIRVGLETPEGMLQVLSGLQPGEKILINGHNFYRKGAKVVITKDLSTPSTADDKGGAKPTGSSKQNAESN